MTCVRQCDRLSESLYAALWLSGIIIVCVLCMPAREFSSNEIAMV